MTGAATASSSGHDMRPSSPRLAGAFAEGATEAGADVVMIGLASTDQLYFASGHLELPGRDVHRQPQPRAYNGIKMCRAGASPIGRRPAWPTIRDRVAAGAAVHATAPGLARARRPRGVRRPPARAWRRSPAAGSRSSSTPATGWPATPRRRCSTASATGRPGAAVLRARRHLPEPRGQPDRAGQPRRPPGGGARRGRRHRPGLRRRRRPLLPRRRARRARRPVHAHRADRRPRAGPGARAPR